MKKPKKLAFVSMFIFLGVSMFSFAQSEDLNAVELERFFIAEEAPYVPQMNHLDSLITWQERVILHVDKKQIAEEEPVFFKAYLLSGTGRIRTAVSKVLKVELLDQNEKVITQQFHKINNGMSEGAVMIPKKLKGGKYFLKAYTRWMQNYGEPYYYKTELELRSSKKSQKINKNQTDLFSVSFHPEGGNLIANISNKLFIKAHFADQNLSELEGKIYDSNGQLVATALRFDKNILSTIFTPLPKEKYVLKINNEFSFPLPNTLNNGYSLNVNNLHNSELNVRISATPGYENSQVLLKGEMSGTTFFEKEVQIKKLSTEVKIPRNGIPFGIMTLSLTDKNDKVWSRRPVSISAQNELKLNVVPLVEGSNTNQHTYKVTVTDQNGNPVATEISVSAVSLGMNTHDQLKEELEDFHWQSFQAEDQDANLRRKRQYINDIELLTSIHGEKMIWSQKVPNRIKYPFQLGLDLFGYAYNLNNELLPNTKIQVLGTSDLDSKVVVQELTTDGSGRIRLENLQLVGETELVFRTSGDNSKSRLVKIVPIQDNSSEHEKRKQTSSFILDKKRNVVNASPWQTPNTDDLIVLDEVQVSKKRNQTKKSRAGLYGIEPTKSKNQDIKKPKTIPELFLGIPGVQITGLGSLNPRIILPATAGAGPVLWVLDGLPLFDTTLSDIIGSVSYIDVDRIELLFGADAAIYGSRASGGVIRIYTRSGTESNPIKRKDGHLNFQGYFESPTFENYAQSVAKRPSKYKDSPTTLFWNPQLKSDENGEVIIRFSVPFDEQPIEIKTSTITEQGQFGSSKFVFMN